MCMYVMYECETSRSDSNRDDTNTNMAIEKATVLEMLQDIHPLYVW